MFKTFCRRLFANEIRSLVAEEVAKAISQASVAQAVVDHLELHVDLDDIVANAIEGTVDVEEVVERVVGESLRNMDDVIEEQVRNEVQEQDIEGSVENEAREQVGSAVDDLDMEDLAKEVIATVIHDWFAPVVGI